MSVAHLVNNQVSKQSAASLLADDPERVSVQKRVGDSASWQSSRAMGLAAAAVWKGLSSGCADPDGVLHG